ncbi:MAG: hypothetical protein ACYC8T_02340 [Myxococcaceae bacterium]
MKALWLVLPLLLAGTTPTTPVPAPPALLGQLRKLTTGDWCHAADWTAPAPLGSARFASLEGGRLLLFLQVPDYLCSGSNTALPVVVDAGGRWRWGSPLQGEVTRLLEGGGALWAVSQWSIEGTYPMLWRSLDGLAWTAVALPEDRSTTGPSEEVSALCLCEGELRLELTGGDDGEAPRRLKLGRPVKALNAAWVTVAAGCERCEAPARPEPAWRREEKKGAGPVVFRRGVVAVSVPERLSKR